MGSNRIKQNERFNRLAKQNMQSTQHNFSILSWLNHQRKSSNSECPIYIRVTVNGKRVEISTQKTVPLQDWDQHSQKVKPKGKDSLLINNYLDLARGRLQTILHQMLASENLFTAAMVKDRFLGRTIKPKYKSLCDAFEYNYRLMEAESKLQKISSKTLLRYAITKNKVLAFMKTTYQCEDKPLPEIRLAFITEFHHYLITKDKLQGNTAHKYLKNLKKVMNLAVGLDWIPSNPFVQFKCSYSNPEREILTQVELNNIMSKELVSERLAEVRDVFIFCCYTGFAHAETYKFSRDAVIKDINGDLLLSTIRAKTKKRESVPLLPIPLAIIEKYRTHPYCLRRDKLLPVKSNQRYNEYLKELMAICGINKSISSHTARHTFATTITLANGVPIESVSSMLGHSNIRTTQIYAKVIQKKVSDDMKLLREKLTVKKDHQMAN